MRFNRQLQPGHRRQSARIARDSQSDFFRVDHPATGVDPDHPVSVDANAGNLTVLNDVDTQCVCSTRISPSNCVMPSGTSAFLQQSAKNRVTGISRTVQVRHLPSDLIRQQQLGVDPVQSHGVAAFCE